MTFRAAFPMLACDDLQRSLAFYRDALGFQETYRFPDDANPVFVTLQLGDGSTIGLGGIADDETGLHGLAQRPITGRYFELCLYCDDVDASTDELRALGHPVLTEPTDTPWQERFAYVADPDGNPIMLAATTP